MPVIPVQSGGADLHLHTTASDGTLSPATMVELARDQGLAAIAITDHDTSAGLAEAVAAGAALGLQVITGIEISCAVGTGTEVHVLGYRCDFAHAPLVELLGRMRGGRRQRAETAVAQLRARGIAVELDRVLELGGETVGRPHLAAALVEMGAARDVRDAFDRFLVPGKPGYVPRPKLSPVEAVQSILAAGGVPVIAHPGLIKDDMWVDAFISAGAAGLEAFHTDHSPQQCRHYARLATQRGLLVTGGSDSHGHLGTRPVLPGHVRVSLDAVAALEGWRQH